MTTEPTAPMGAYQSDGCDSNDGAATASDAGRAESANPMCNRCYEEARQRCPHDIDGDPLCQCQGCGAFRSISWRGKAHNCWRNEDGSYEEGGTFQ